MPNGYHHLNRDKRCQLYTLMKRGDSLALIAKELQVDRSTIHREIKRNRGKRGYRYNQAQEKALNRRSSSSQKRKKMSDSMTAIIKEKLNLQWSPEQISGWLKKKEHQAAVSHETIYNMFGRTRKMEARCINSLDIVGRNTISVAVKELDEGVFLGEQIFLKGQEL